MYNLILSAVLTFGPTALAQDFDGAEIQLAKYFVPPGNYHRTCHGCSWAGMFFYCHCEPNQGPPIFTGVYYNQACPGHSLRNVDGHLRCE